MKTHTLTAVLACALAFPAAAAEQRSGRNGSSGGQITYRPARRAPVARSVVPRGLGWPVSVVPAAPDAAPAPAEPPASAVPTPTPEASLIQPSPTVALPFQSGAAGQGSLRLDNAPPNGVLYVDGFFAGKTDDIARSPAGLQISAGWHRLEFRAPGFETLASNVTIVAGRSSTVRASLHSLQH